MSEQILEEEKGKSRVKLGKTIQVRLVSDLAKSQAYYRDCLGFSIDDWGHAERDDVCFILQQAVACEDVKPNAVSAKRGNYPTEWDGPDYGWDTYIHIGWEEFDEYVEEVRGRGGIIGIEAFIGEHGGWEFKNAHIHDLDQYNIVLGAMRRKA
ncbi:VOC family protein [Paenibacillus sp. MMO-177]|uniref:VOC family protein n=1 Tax=Paenibacillus sp. MMO-177 TaxID=3081289 RepID=UPI00301A479E